MNTGEDIHEIEEELNTEVKHQQYEHENPNDKEFFAEWL